MRRAFRRLSILPAKSLERGTEVWKYGSKTCVVCTDFQFPTSAPPRFRTLDAAASRAYQAHIARNRFKPKHARTVAHSTSRRLSRAVLLFGYLQRKACVERSAQGGH